MTLLKHPNVVSLKFWFYDTHDRIREDGSREQETYLNLVQVSPVPVRSAACGTSWCPPHPIRKCHALCAAHAFVHAVQEYVPDTVYKVTRYYTKLRQLPPIICVKLYVYQMCRSLAYLHMKGICHRDIKPQNLLVDPKSHILKLCDFGSAKALNPGEPSVSYICSRYYRAPELIFGATDYTCAIDVWSAGCVAAELLLGHPLFPGDTGVDQVVEIIKVLGTPTKEEVEAMNPAYTEFKFPQIRGFPWQRIFRPRTPAEAIDLISRLVCYVPTQRLSALEACAHPFFDELRNPSTVLPNDQPLPPLFDWTDEELAAATPELREILVPPHVRPPGWSSGLAGGTMRPPVMRAALAPPAAASAGAQVQSSMPVSPQGPSLHAVPSNTAATNGSADFAVRAAAASAVHSGMTASPAPALKHYPTAAPGSGSQAQRR